MSKRQEIREKRRRERLRSRLLMIFLVIAGALLITFALILPTIEGLSTPVAAVNTVEPRTFSVPSEGNTIGDPAAPVRMDTWEDFQCPACVNFSFSTMQQIINDYVETGKVFYTYHFYPFIDDRSASKESDQAANAALCAGDQGQFWAYHDTVYTNWNGENQGAFADKNLVHFAEVLDLDILTFKACLDSGQHMPEIEADFSAGEAAGVTSTPYIFINMERVLAQAGEQYVPGYEDIAAAIEAALTTP